MDQKKNDLKLTGGGGNLVVNSMKISNEVPEERRQKML